MKNNFYKFLNLYIPNPKCELNYNKDYELLIATILSAQCTDKRVNIVTNDLFSKYDLNMLASLDINTIKRLIRSCGNYDRKSFYLKVVSERLISDFNGTVPNDREYLESLPGVGRKTANVVLKNLFNVPCIPVDTHVERVSKRLGLVDENDSVKQIEEKLMVIIPNKLWNRVSEQLLLFGRYFCKSVNPNCSECLFKNDCKYNKNS